MVPLLLFVIVGASLKYKTSLISEHKILVCANPKQEINKIKRKIE